MHFQQCLFCRLPARVEHKTRRPYGGYPASQTFNKIKIKSINQNCLLNQNYINFMHHKNFHILNYKIIFVNVCIMVGIAWRAASWTELIPSRKHSLLDIRRIFNIRTAGFPLWRKMGWELLKENKQEKKKENTLLTKKTIKKKKKKTRFWPRKRSRKKESFFHVFLGRERVF